LIVSDNGIGMTADTLINYYLMAGSSYRYSDNWASDFIVNEKGTIPRTGKFGIGVLSTFLLGEKIHIETKHFYDELGMVLDFNLNDSIINVTKSNNVNIGSTVRVELTDKMIDRISFTEYSGTSKFNKINKSLVKNVTGDMKNEVIHEIVNKHIRFQWYFLETPSITYIVDEFVNENKVFVPGENTHYANWFDARVSDFTSYMWTYDDPLTALPLHERVGAYNPQYGLDHTGGGYTRTRVFYNGIIIPKEKRHYFTNRLHLPMPYVSIIDKDNKLNISLDRNKCVLPNSRELLIEQYKYFIAELLLCPKDILRRGEFYSDHIIYLNKCFTLENLSFLKLAGIQKIFIVDRLMKHFNLLLSDLSCLPVRNIEANISELKKQIHDGKITMFTNDLARILYSDSVEKICCTDRVKVALASLLLEPKDLNKVIDILNNSIEIERIYKLTAAPMVFEVNLYREEDSSEDSSDESDDDSDDDLTLVISELLGSDIWIPIDFDKRKEKFPDAFKVLERFMEVITNNAKNKNKPHPF